MRVSNNTFSLVEKSYRVAVTDELGRSWSYYNMTISANIASTFPINSQSSNDYYLPLDIMKKGVKAVDYVGYNGSLIYVRDQGGVASNFYAYLHFCDVEQTQNDELREFNISLNYSPWLESIEPVYLKTTTVHKKILGAGSGAILLTFERTNRSTLPPILNALELYVEKELPQSPTVPEDGMLLSYIIHLFIVHALHCIAFRSLKESQKDGIQMKYGHCLFLKPWDKKNISKTNLWTMNCIRSPIRRPTKY